MGALEANARKEGLRLTIDAATGTLYDPSTGKPIRIRGLNWGRRVTPPANVYNSSDPALMRQILGKEINHVRLVLDFYSVLNGKQMDPTDIFANEPSMGYIAPKWLTYIDNAVEWVTSAGMWMTITYRNNVGTNSPHGGPKPPCAADYLNNATARNIWHDSWKFLAQRYKATDRIAWYEVASEPHLTPVFGEAACGHTDTEIMGLLEGAVAAIRSVDSETPVAISPEYDACPGLSIATKLSDAKVIYAINWWCSKNTGYGTNTTCGDAFAQIQSPCVSACANYSKGHDVAVEYSAATLQDLLQPAVIFQQKHKVPVWVDQLGCGAGVQPGSSAFMRDTFELLDQHGIVHWTWWTWMGGTMGVLDQPCPTNTCKRDYDNYVVNEAVLKLVQMGLG